MRSDNLTHSLIDNSVLDKNTNYKNDTSEINIINEYLKTNLATATMLEDATGIHQKNICRHKRTLEIQGILFEVKHARCKITGKPAWYLSTDENLKPPTNQLKLFD